MKNYKYVMVAILLLGLPFVLTSCEDILGHWEKPVNSSPVYDPYAEPLTLEAIEDGAIEVIFAGDVTLPKPITYTRNGGASTEITKTSNTISVNAGDKICFYSENSSMGVDTYEYLRIEPHNKCYVYGNIMSIINDEGDFSKDKVINTDFAFYSFFYLGSALYNHPEKKLLLPATTVSKSCYRAMFDGCHNLTTPPDLPATNLAERCYSTMFSSCSGLTSAPELPATVLAESCYARMFLYCKNITTAPDLNAPKLVNRCYSGMFEHCYKIGSVTCRATSGFDCTEPFLYWLAGTGQDAEGPLTIYVPASQSTTWTTAPINTYVADGWTLSPTL